MSQARSVPNSQSTAQESLRSEKATGKCKYYDAEKVRTSSDLVDRNVSGAAGQL